MDKDDLARLFQVLYVLAEGLEPGHDIGGQHEMECVLLWVQASIPDDLVALTDQVEDAQIVIRVDVRDEDSPNFKQNLFILLVPVMLSDLNVRALSAVKQHLALSPFHHYR